MKLWNVQRDWEGETVVIIAGGPSLTDDQVEYVRKSGAKVIAINNAYLMAPFADILYACDYKWWKWHDGAKDFEGMKVCLRYAMATEDLEGEWPEDEYTDVRSLAYHKLRGISREPGIVNSGRDSGYQAIQLALQLGAARIVLLGYDLKSETLDLDRDVIVTILDAVLGKGYPVLKREAIARAMVDIRVPHWHGHHPDNVPPPFDLMLEYYESMQAALFDSDAEIVNCTPGTALHYFWEADLKEAI